MKKQECGPGSSEYSKQGGQGRSSDAGDSGIASKVQHTVKSGYEQAAQKVGKVTERASEMLGQRGEMLKSKYNSARETFTYSLEERPLLLGGISFVAGLLLGSFLPRSSVERRVVGDSGRKLVEQVKRTGSEIVDRAAESAEQVARSFAEPATEHHH